MKEKFNQMFKDKLFLVMLVLGLLTIVAAAGVVTIQRGSGQQENPYVDMQGQEEFLAEEPDGNTLVAGESNAQAADPQQTEEMQMANEDTGDSAPEDTRIADAAQPEPDSPDGDTNGGRYEAAADGAETGDTGDAGSQAQAVGGGLDAATALVLDFTDTSKMTWPLRGNIILDYNMDSTIYFPTLDQYKCNPGLVIQGEVSDPVCAPANARVTGVGINEEIGNYLELDLGNGYTAVCGQLKEIPVVEGEYLEQGQLLGYVAEPTKYYTVEGSNVFFELKHEDQAVDPLDYME